MQMIYLFSLYKPLCNWIALEEQSMCLSHPVTSDWHVVIWFAVLFVSAFLFPEIESRANSEWR